MRHFRGKSYNSLMPLDAYADSESRAAKSSFTIVGLTSSGQTFRPSDWADRLCGIMGQFQPPGVQASHLSYCPYVQPSVRDGNKCVEVDGRLDRLEPLAYKFLLSFVKDNDLQTFPVQVGV